MMMNKVFVVTREINGIPCLQQKGCFRDLQKALMFAGFDAADIIKTKAEADESGQPCWVKGKDRVTQMEVR